MLESIRSYNLMYVAKFTKVIFVTVKQSNYLKNILVKNSYNQMCYVGKFQVTTYLKFFFSSLRKQVTSSVKR